VTVHLFHLEFKQTFLALCVRFAISVSCAVVLACISKRFLEEPFLRLKDRLAPLAVRAPQESLTTIPAR
jgi:peptidoglycan/LPS O-acetylase OafA/YrhL